MTLKFTAKANEFELKHQIANNYKLFFQYCINISKLKKNLTKPHPTFLVPLNSQINMQSEYLSLSLSFYFFIFSLNLHLFLTDKHFSFHTLSDCQTLSSLIFTGRNFVGYKVNICLIQKYSVLTKYREQIIESVSKRISKTKHIRWFDVD
jgi:hypothetical protein